MNVLIVYAHHESKSFNAAMKELAASVLTHQGHQVKVSDLYAMKFKSAADRHDFQPVSNASHINYMLEQRENAKKDSFTMDIKEEQEKLKWADLVVFQFPIWWFSVPAILKGWFDRVLAAGVAWNFGMIYDKGLFRGKKAMLAVTTGGPKDLYSKDGAHAAGIVEMLHPILHGTLFFCGMDVLPPFVAYGVFQAGEEGRKRYLEEYKNRLLELDRTTLLKSH